MRRQWRLLAEITLLLIIVTGSVAVFVFRDELDSIGDWGYIGVFFLCLLSNFTVFLPAPSLMVVVSSAQILSPFFVATIGAFGTTVGEMAGYICGRIGHDVSVRFSKLIDKLSRVIQKDFLFVFILALLPLPIFDAAGVYAGGNKMRTTKFMMSCFVGKWLKMLFYAFFFQSSMDYLVKLI